MGPLTRSDFGERMKLKQLNERDANAVDAILMNGRTMNSSTAAVADDAERIRAASKVLSLLDNLPDEEVPADLARRTLQRINGGSGVYRGISDDRPTASGPNA